ncbi:MAG: DNA mismatch repair endonuclease MutL [Acidobacteria bacterium]|nr:DNA mismatch repair endonuclease MutL [Acidobacteriota bacterium]
MGRIRILSDTVANKIAAGEVVERPASVVKELLENSLDAGARDVRVAVEAGGRRMIRIADDGCGMLRDDAMLAFERHATSKLSDVRDLLSIATLGFRGEALPSIASVSRLLLESRSEDEESGTRVEIAGGKLLRCEEAALPRGTVITVRDLFYNVPARKKFLRSEQTELAHIASLVTHYSLAHPNRGFQLHHGASELLSVSPVAEIRDRVYQVFGSQTMEDLVDLGTQERDLELPPPYLPPSASVGAQLAAEAEAEAEGPVRAFCLRGFVSRPQVQKSNRNSIYLFVNGRLIRDKLLMHAISQAYANLMPGSSYPFALLFLDCDCEEVDVNVHPAKTEVRFRHPSFVHDFIRDVIREVLIGQRPASSVPARYSPIPSAPPPPEPQRAAALPFSEFSQTMHEAGYDPVVAQGAQPATELRPVVPNAQPQRDEDLPAVTLHHQAAPLRLGVPDTHGPLPNVSIDYDQPTMASLRDLRPLGQLHDSFIIAAGRDGLWIIDQHVAHERILFERVLKERGAGRVEMQSLLLPIVLELTPGQQVEYARIADELNRTGFETEPFGNRTIAVKAAPAGVGLADIEWLVFEILEISEKELRTVSLEDQRRAIAASVACRAAIKINMRLDMAKMEWLLAALAATEYPMSCPHGRPVAMRYSMRDILKGFHRI